MIDESLAGCRVMVVEDEMLISMMIEEILEERGCTVVGPYSNVPEALAAATDARDGAVDVALLDVNLRGEKVYPVAWMLQKRGIPFVLLSGYGDDAIPRGASGWRACFKPFEASKLMRALSDQLAASGGPARR